MTIAERNYDSKLVTAAAENTTIASLRQQHFEQYQQLGWPRRKQEAWKYLDLAELKQFTPLAAATTNNSVTISDFISVQLDVYLVVLINGKLSTEQSDLDALKQIIHVSTLQELTSAEHYGMLTNHNPFAALNTAIAQYGLYLNIPAGVRLNKPIHLLHISDQVAEHHIHHSIRVGEQASAAIIESFYGSESYINNHLTELSLASHASLYHYRKQLESTSAYHLASTQIHADQNSHYQLFATSLGAKLARHDIVPSFIAEHTKLDLHGFYRATGQQQQDIFIGINHDQSHCQSSIDFRGLADYNAVANFNGTIRVQNKTLNTSAHMQNKNLLLSPTATVNTRPNLEIYAHDVQCSHGATVGELDEQALFYLRSRGIPELTAKAILLQGFAKAVFNQINDPSLRDYLNHEQELSHV